MKFEKAFELYRNYCNSNFKKRSLESINSIYINYLLPYFKNKNIEDIKKIDILNFELDLKKYNHSYKYNKCIYTILAMFFKWLVKYLDIEKNVVSEVGYIIKNDEMPKKKINIWTFEEFNQFIKHVDNKIYKCFFEFLFYTGCRLGEATALKFTDLRDNTISITKTAIRGKEINSPKTKNSIRDIEINDFLLDKINELKKYYKKKYGYFDNSFYIFGGKKNLSYSTVTRKKNEACKKANVKIIRIHDFRHSHISFLISNGIPIKTVCNRVGHGDASTTLNIYAHENIEDKKKVLTLLSTRHDNY